MKFIPLDSLPVPTRISALVTRGFLQLALQWSVSTRLSEQSLVPNMSSYVHLEMLELMNQLWVAFPVEEVRRLA